MVLEMEPGFNRSLRAAQAPASRAHGKIVRGNFGVSSPSSRTCEAVVSKGVT